MGGWFLGELMPAKKNKAKPEPHRLTYRTKEHNGGRHPQCQVCLHYSERVFSATEETHWIETKDSEPAFLCVQCWSEHKKEEEDQ